MTTIFDRMLRRIADLPGTVMVGHYGWPVPLAAGIGLHVGPVWGLPARLVAVAPVVAGSVVVAAHAQELFSCPPCRARLAAPADAQDLQAEADRREWLLRLTHAPWRSVPVWALVAAAFALDMWGGQPGQGWGRWMSAAPMAAVFVLGLVTGPRTHARLEAACPWCQAGDDGGHGGDDDPDDPQIPPGPHGRRRSLAGADGCRGDRQSLDAGVAVAVPDFADELITRWETDGVPGIPDPVAVPLRGRARVHVPQPRVARGGPETGGAR